jgi:hypothetical protein
MVLDGTIGVQKFANFGLKLRLRRHIQALSYSEGNCFQHPTSWRVQQSQKKKKIFLKNGQNVTFLSCKKGMMDASVRA